MYDYQFSQELETPGKGLLYTPRKSSVYPTLYGLGKKGVISARQERLIRKRKIRIPFDLPRRNLKN